MSAHSPREIEHTASSGNVFADLGFDAPEELLLKAELANAISRVIRERKLTQTTAAQLMRLDQPKVSAIIRGRLSGFSVERLLECLTALEQDVTIMVRPAAASRGKILVNVG